MSAFARGVRLAFTVLLLALEASPSQADRGLVYGEGHAFFVTSPPSWVLDKESGQENGLQAVLYPQGGSWNTSPTVMYVNTVRRNPKVDLRTFMDRELTDFRKQNGPVKSEEASGIRTSDQKLGAVRHLWSDEWANREAIAYIEERKVFVLVVLTARSAAEYSEALAAFEALVRSYQFITDDPENATDQFDLIKALADDNRKTPIGAKYDERYAQYFARRYGSTVERCIDSVVDPDTSGFEVLVRLAIDGKPSDVLLQPETNVARCLRDAMKRDRHPKPPRPRYWVRVVMMIQGIRTSPLVAQSAKNGGDPCRQIN